MGVGVGSLPDFHPSMGVGGFLAISEITIGKEIMT
jgi:hypothetical protein